jgi:hypothetical protein
VLFQKEVDVAAQLCKLAACSEARATRPLSRAVAAPQAIDMFSSAPWFDGFREVFTVRDIEAVVRPVTEAHTWLLTIGWRRHGLLSVHEVPA